MKFLISAAGTGGHVFPALEFGRECIKSDHEVLWIGTKTGIENRVLPKNIKLLNLCGCMDVEAKNFKSHFIKEDNSKCIY